MFYIGTRYALGYSGYSALRRNQTSTLRVPLIHDRMPRHGYLTLSPHCSNIFRFRRSFSGLPSSDDHWLAGNVDIDRNLGDIDRTSVIPVV